MNLFSSPTLRVAAATFGLAVLASVSHAAEPEGLSAADLAARLSGPRQSSTLVRLRMELKQPPSTTRSVLQLQIKERRNGGSTELVYQVLFPKERKGESVLLRKSGNRPASGTLFIPPDSAKPLSAGQMSDSLFGSDLSYEDVIENFFAWDNQAIVGTEVVDRVPCQILESKPGKGERSSYTSVRTWVDTRRFVPLRIEKYRGSGSLVRRIDTTRVVATGGRQIPANLTIRGPRGDSATDLDGSRIKHGVDFSDREFSAEGFQEVNASRSAPE